jgi:hypothetical protein
VRIDKCSKEGSLPLSRRNDALPCLIVVSTRYRYLQERMKVLLQFSRAGVLVQEDVSDYFEDDNSERYD